MSDPTTQLELFAVPKCPEQLAGLAAREHLSVAPAAISSKPVNPVRPQHYNPGPYEVIKVIQAWDLLGNACLFNVIKYVARHAKKDPAKQLDDLKKAKQYLCWEIDRLEGRPLE